MNYFIDRRFASLAFRILFSAAVCVSLLPGMGRPANAQDTLLGVPVTDPLGVASFIPPEDWVRWNFWGAIAFSPTAEYNSRITFIVTPDADPDGNAAQKAMDDYEETFSTDNYTLIQKENLYLDGWSGIRILAGGTDQNPLFGRDYIWIQEYFTDRNKISLVFRSDPATFETYRDAVLGSFGSLNIIERGRDGL